MKTKTINGIEYEIESHDFDKKLSDIKIPKGWRLWKAHECWLFYEDKKLRKEMNLEDCWFFVEQPRDNTSDVAGFDAGSGRAYLDCYWGPLDTYSSLGVRFCRKKIKGRKR